MKNRCFYWSWMLLLAGLSLSAAQSQSLSRTTPEAVGLSAARLTRLDQLLQQHIDQTQLPGAVALIVRRGRIAHLRAYGMSDREAQKPMTEDAIFRIASMTKPITTVAALMLMEEGKFLLDDPVAKYLPAFQSLRVLIPDAKSKIGYRIESAKSPITIRHLLTHTSGIIYGFSNVPFLTKMYHDAGISDGLSQTNDDLSAWAERLAKMPLAHQPGERFTYGLNTDLLGRLIEIWSEMPFDSFLQKRIFEPLQLKNTGFFLPEEKVNRLVTLYEPNSEGDLLKTPLTEQRRGASVYSASYHYAGPRKFFSGGAGLYSTAADYARFAQMLLNRGELDGVRLLSRKTIELMTSDQLGEVAYPWGQGTRFGFGVYVENGPAATGRISSAGTFGWSGFFITYFWIDPQEELIAILMTQMQPNPTNIAEKFRVMVYQSIID